MATLGRCFLIVGIPATALPTGHAKDLMLQFTVESYGEYTTEQFIEAFTLAARQELDCDVNHYQNPSCAYIGRIMSAYFKHLKATGRIRSNFELERQAGNYNQNLLTYTPPSMQPAEKVEMSRQLYYKLRTAAAIMPGTYEAMIELEMLSLSDDVKRKYMNEATQAWKSLRNRETITDRLQWKQEFAKRLVVIDFFNREIQEDERKEQIADID